MMLGFNPIPMLPSRSKEEFFYNHLLEMCEQAILDRKTYFELPICKYEQIWRFLCHIPNQQVADYTKYLNGEIVVRGISVRCEELRHKWLDTVAEKLLPKAKCGLCGGSGIRYILWQPYPFECIGCAGTGLQV